MDRICRNCKYHDDYTHSCCNGLSHRVADFTEDDDWCGEYVRREDGSNVPTDT